MVRVSKVRLVTAWNQHGATIPLIDIGQCDQGIDLPTHQPLSTIAVLVPHDGRKSPGVQADGFAGMSKVGKVFVDEEQPVMVAKSACSTHKMFDLLDPGRMANQLFEWFTGLVDLL